PIGFSCIEMAIVAGAGRIIVSELVPYQRAKALEIGADAVIDPVNENLVERVRELTGGRMCDCAIEATGNGSAIADAVLCLRRGGRAVWVGMGKPTAQIPHAEVIKREATILGVYRYANDFEPVVRLLEAGRLKPERWVSHHFPLERIVEAITTAANPKVERLKIVVTT
ncbi:MAG TPA: zinc-binding dehydrogenase, partial [Spirochaetia bacterium]